MVIVRAQRRAWRASPLPVRTQYTLAPEPLLVALITAGFILCGAWMAAGYDSGRDMAAAWAIAHDGARPLTGPLVAGSVQLGPLWFYLLALPLAISSTWLAGALTATVLAALQFPLAYLAGTRLAGRTLGLLWAVALVLPGWGSFESVGFASTNLVRVSVVATLYALIRARTTPHSAWWLLAGLAAAVALHAHPSTVWLLPIVLWQALRHPGILGQHFRDAVVALGATSVGIALPFIPLAWSAPALLGSAAQVADANAGFAQLLRTPALLWSVAWDGAATLFATLASASRAAHAAAVIASLLGIAGALAGIAGALRGERIARMALALTLVSTLCVAFLRTSTPLYMLYTVVPCFALLVATGWQRLLRGRALLLVVLPALACAATAGAMLVRAQQAGGGFVDGARIINVTAAPATRVPADVWLPAYAVDALGRWLCARPAAVYGALPYLLDVHYTLPLRMHCPQSMATIANESAGRTGYVGLARARWRELGASPPQAIAGIGIAAATALIAAPPRRDFVLDARYPPHPYVAGDAVRAAYAFTLPAGQALVIANPRVTWMPGWQADVRCNGIALPPATADAVTRVYRCPGDAASTQWEVAITAIDPRAVELVGIALPPRRAAL